MEMEKFKCAYDELVDVEKLVPNPKNNNIHPKKQIERLAKIIDFQGQRAPVVVSKRSGFIVKGHGRLEAIKLLGWGKCAVDYQDYENEAQEYADMVADNQIATWSEFDDEMLLKELPELDLDLDMLGMIEIPKLEEEKEQLSMIIKRWGSKIVKNDMSDRSHSSDKKKKIDYNPVVQVPIKGV